jgi:hypothetical protein
MSFFDSRLKKTIFGVLFAFIASYLVLLVPSSTYPEPGEGEREPFVWNQDDYFQLLESRFSDAKSMEPGKLNARIDGRLSKIDKSVKSLSSGVYYPEDEIFESIETELFELAPPIAAKPERITEFIERLKINRVDGT